MYDREYIDMLRESAIETKAAAVLMGENAQIAALIGIIGFLGLLAILVIQAYTSHLVQTSVFVWAITVWSVGLALLGWALIAINNLRLPSEIERCRCR